MKRACACVCVCIIFCLHNNTFIIFYEWQFSIFRCFVYDIVLAAGVPTLSFLSAVVSIVFNCIVGRWEKSDKNVNSLDDHTQQHTHIRAIPFHVTGRADFMWASLQCNMRDIHTHTHLRLRSMAYESLTVMKLSVFSPEKNLIAEFSKSLGYCCCCFFWCAVLFLPLPVALIWRRLCVPSSKDTSYLFYYCDFTISVNNAHTHKHENTWIAMSDHWQHCNLFGSHMRCAICCKQAIEQQQQQQLQQP